MWPRFANRREAGRELASALSGYAGRPDVLVLGLPRGGVPVAFEVAQALRLPLDVFLVRKLGAPGQEELAVGAIASGGVRVLNAPVMQALGLWPDALEEVARRERAELERRERAFRGERPPPAVAGRTALLIDDGLATGSTMRAAVAAIRKLGPERIVVAVPVAAVDVCDRLAAEVDELVCLERPEDLYAVGLWYRDFQQTTDDEVRALLAAAEGGGAPEVRV